MMKAPRLTQLTVASGQQGFVTMVIAISLLTLTTMVVLNVGNSILMEQRISNNEARSRQAFEAAEAGMSAAIAYLQQGRDRDNNGVIDPVFDTNNDGIGDTNTAVVGNNLVIVTTTDLSGDMASVQIASQGFSDDRSSTRIITYTLITINPLPNTPDNPLTARAGIIISGSATVHNPEGHSTIWSGANVDMGSNNSTSTNVPDIGSGGYPACMDFPMTCSLVASSNRLTLGLDVIENDSSLGGLTNDEFFLNYFGMSPQAYRASMVTVDTTPARVGTDVHLATHEVIWIEGDTTFGNITVGCTTHVPGNNVCPAANTRPSIVIVNGNASFSGTPKFYGLLFVRGNVAAGGNTTVTGAMVIGGAATSTTGGSLDVWYNSNILAGTRFAGAATGSAGTWRDF